MIKIDKLNPFGRLCVTLGMLPSSYKESLTYEEQLLWMLNYIEKTLIPTINNNAQAVEELQALYLELKSYVDSYFENLDVQQEINNKLDQMAESGQLTEIIAQYLGLAGVLAFNTLNDLKNAENIDRGLYVGITKVPSGNYQASITVNYESIYLGTFNTKDEALFARYNAEIKYFGDNRVKDYDDVKVKIFKENGFITD